MKILKMMMALVLLTTPLMARDKAQTMTMEDFDAAMNGFSFSRGALVSVSPDDESLPMEIDFIFDIPNGIGMNNGALGDWFKGAALVADLGDLELNSKVSVDEGDYSPFLVPDEIIIGHTYQMMTADAAKIGRIRVVEYDYDSSHLVFEWLRLK